MSNSQTRRRPLKLYVKVELTEDQAQQISSNSIERVINNSINMAYFVEDAQHAEEHLKEDASICQQDWEDLKPIATQIWNAVRNEIFVHYNDPKRANRPTTQQHNIIVRDSD